MNGTDMGGKIGLAIEHHVPIRAGVYHGSHGRAVFRFGDGPFQQGHVVMVGGVHDQSQFGCGDLVKSGGIESAVDEAEALGVADGLEGVAVPEFKMIGPG